MSKPIPESRFVLELFMTSKKIEELKYFYLDVLQIQIRQFETGRNITCQCITISKSIRLNDMDNK